MKTFSKEILEEKLQQYKTLKMVLDCKDKDWIIKTLEDFVKWTIPETEGQLEALK